MSPRRYAIIGTGALGGFYGARLQRGGRETHFLLRSDYEHVRRQGLRVDSPEGDFLLPEVLCHQTPADMPRCDVVVVSLKTTRNDALKEILPLALAEPGVVLTLQNGLGVEDGIARIVGSEHVMGGLAFLCSNKVGPGHIQHLDYGAIALGEYTPDHTPAGTTRRMRDIGSDFEDAGIPVSFYDDLQSARWHKLVWNVPFNGLSVVLRAATDQIMRSARHRQRAEELMRDVVRGAAACGYTIEDAFVTKMLHDTDRMVPYRPSMLIDFEAGRPMEVEAILGNPLRAAREAGAALPAIASLYEELRALAT